MASSDDVIDVADIDALLSDDERATRDAVRAFVERRVIPHVGDWFERGEIDDLRGLAKDLGQEIPVCVHRPEFTGPKFKPVIKIVSGKTPPG